MNGGTLDGILVVDLTRYLPGPFATRELLRLGARVVRMEPPAGDPMRVLAPGWHGWLNAGKQSVVCDLKRDPAFGRALCAEADVVVEGFRPGVAERLGVGPEHLRAGVVYCSIRGFGERGVWTSRVGHDVNYLGLAGVLDETAPALPPLPIADLAAGGLTAVARILGGLYLRERTGRGSVHRISMTDEAHRLVAFRKAGEAVVPRLLNGGVACYDVYRTADGRWLSVGALETSFFTRLCELLDAPGLAARQFDVAGQDEIRTSLAALFGSRTQAEWIRFFGDEEVAVAPVLGLEEAAAEADESTGPPCVLGADTDAWKDRLRMS